MGVTESKEISLPQVDLKMGTIMSCDISQQISLFALDKVLNSTTHFHAVGICVSFLMSLSSESHLHGPSDTPPPHTHKLDPGFQLFLETWGRVALSCSN